MWATATSDQIPTLPSGKLNRKALRAMVIAGDFALVGMTEIKVRP
jgi:hypothetical protein